MIFDIDVERYFAALALLTKFFLIFDFYDKAIVVFNLGSDPTAI